MGRCKPHFKITQGHVGFVVRVLLLFLEQFPEKMREKEAGAGSEGKAEDAGGLTPVKDGSAPLRFLDR